MKIIKRLFVVIFCLAFIIPDIPAFAADSVYSKTYTQMMDYDYGEKNKGFYMVPDAEGQYPVIFMFHGSAEKSSSNWEYRSYLMDTVNKWIALGFMDPMVIVVPNIEREDEKDDWSCYAFNYYVTKNRFGTLLKKIKNGECEFDDKVDHSKKFSVTGFSMGGVESLFIGTNYKNDILNIGACSPSYMYYHMSGTNDDGWVKKDKVNFTSDPDAHFFMGYGIKENGFRESVERYISVYKENKTSSQKDFEVYGSYSGGHTWETFSREIFCFVYYMKHDTLPDEETIELACKDRNLNYGEGGSSNGNDSGNSTDKGSGNDQNESGGNIEKGSGDGQKESNGNIDKGTGDDQKNKSSSTDKESSASRYSNEWINGKWYDANGNQTYDGILSWKCNSTGWWVEDSSGWYPQSSWQKIDGVWYYFKPDGYMASSEYYGGYWLSGDGTWDEQYYLTWKCNSTGWWAEDKSGWWPASKWLKINSCWYYFDESGYMVTNQFVDGYWIGADGVSA